MLAVDVDGTLVAGAGPDPTDVAALHHAAAAGMVVCLCTGRAWPEVRAVWEGLRLPQPAAPVVCVGGALVVEPQTGRTLYSRPFARETAAELGEAMREMGYAVMALVDGWREAFDYYLMGPWRQDPLLEQFFRRRRSRFREVQRLDPRRGPRILRISVLDDGDGAAAVARTMRQRFAGRIEIQAIHLPRTGVHIAEAFAAGTHKLSALTYVGQGRQVARAAMAAIGDDLNDLVMLKGVGFSAAPADAPEELRAAADLVVAARGKGCVAEFVRAVLGGPQPTRRGNADSSSSQGRPPPRS
jgi:HAD superfamily hydrolase (TIGR01484 family)